MKKIIDRLAEYIELKDISLNAFDKSIGMSNGYIGKQIKNKASIGGDIIEKIACVHTDLNIDWLITGKGELLKNSDEVMGKAMPTVDVTATLLLKRVEELSVENYTLKQELDELTAEKKIKRPVAYGMVAEPELTKK